MDTTASPPASMDERLDELFARQDAAADQADADQTDDLTETDDDGYADDGDEGDAGSPDAASPDGTEEGEESTDSEAEPAEDEWTGVPAHIRTEVEQNRVLLQRAAQIEQHRIAQAKEAQFEQQYQQWVKDLDNMDPDDRQAEIIKVLSDDLGRRLLQEQQSVQVTQAQQTFQAQHSATLDFVSGGHRVQATGRRMPSGEPEFRRVDSASLPLTEQEKKVVAKVTGGPLAMQAAADELVAMRRGQTQAARQALANKRRENNEGPTIASGRQGSGPKPPDRPDYTQTKRLDDKLDMFLDYHEQRSGGPLQRRSG